MTSFKKAVLFAGDVVILYLSLAATLFSRYGIQSFSESVRTHIGPFSLIFLVWLLTLYLADLYHIRTLRSKGSILSTLSIAVVVAGTLSTIIFYLFGGFFKLTPKTNLLIFGVIFLLLNYGWRSFARSWFVSGAANVAILGTGQRVAEVIEYLSHNPHAGYRAATWIKEPSAHLNDELTRATVTNGITSIILPPNASKNFSILRALYQLLPIEVALIPFSDFYELIFEKEPLDELDETWFIENISTRRPFYDSTKRVVDLTLAFLLLAIFAPLSVFIAAAVAASSRGPVVYRQERVGKNGKLFTLYKFRTMKDEGGGALWTELNDRRVTAVGRFLRFSHLDEIPQLINIIRGDISFIGPRPERRELAEQFSTLPYYEVRHVVKPGLTGWAQINFQPSASLEEAFEKLKYDVFYIKNRSLILDILIVLRTIKHFFLSHT